MEEKQAIFCAEIYNYCDKILESIKKIIYRVQMMQDFFFVYVVEKGEKELDYNIMLKSR
jgi:hypothetical protein